MSAPVSACASDGLRASAADVLHLGYVALTDAAPLLVADELGFFTRLGVRVALHLVPSWASVRDRLAFGALHGAQLLSPMALAGAVGLGGIGTELRVVSTLSSQGNTLVLGLPLWQEIETGAPDLAGSLPLPAAALARVVATRRGAGGRQVRLAVVYPFSSHNYLLRHWLAAAGIDPDRDTELVVVPPAGTVAALRDGLIDGFCAGAPWGNHAARAGVGRVALCSSQVWPHHPEKVLCVTRQVLQTEPAQVAALVGAAMQAAEWLADPANRDDACRILAQRALFLPADVIRAGLADAAARPVFPTGADCFPHPQHGWAWLGQMRRWNHIPPGQMPDPASIWDSTAWLAAIRSAARETGRAVCPAVPAWPIPVPGDLPEDIPGNIPEMTEDTQ